MKFKFETINLFFIFIILFLVASPVIADNQKENDSCTSIMVGRLDRL